MLSVHTLVYKKTLYSRIICGVPAETCSFLVFPPARTSVMCHSLVQRLSGGARGCVVRILVSPAARQTPTLTSCLTHVTVSGVWCYLELLWHRVSHEPGV